MTIWEDSAFTQAFEVPGSGSPFGRRRTTNVIGHVRQQSVGQHPHAVLHRLHGGLLGNDIGQSTEHDRCRRRRRRPISAADQFRPQHDGQLVAGLCLRRQSRRDHPDLPAQRLLDAGSSSTIRTSTARPSRTTFPVGLTTGAADPAVAAPMVPSSTSPTSISTSTARARPTTYLYSRRLRPRSTWPLPARPDRLPCGYNHHRNHDRTCSCSSFPARPPALLSRVHPQRSSLASIKATASSAM